MAINHPPKSSLTSSTLIPSFLPLWEPFWTSSLIKNMGKQRPRATQQTGRKGRLGKTSRCVLQRCVPARSRPLLHPFLAPPPAPPGSRKHPWPCPALSDPPPPVLRRALGSPSGRTQTPPRLRAGPRPSPAPEVGSDPALSNSLPPRLGSRPRPLPPGRARPASGRNARGGGGAVRAGAGGARAAAAPGAEAAASVRGAVAAPGLFVSAGRAGPRLRSFPAVGTGVAALAVLTQGSS